MAFAECIPVQAGRQRIMKPARGVPCPGTTIIVRRRGRCESERLAPWCGSAEAGTARQISPFAFCHVITGAAAIAEFGEIWD